ncbi:MAG: proton extrusion protein PcxA [Symploca sp. SIO1C4]|uniref:Proton extrusion protein PxcA n=1 Tax=Symploca sp. SIO1C4 TaxID=2607765 RepID=A0A6B3NL90_9CYAN|nr:proton extrusion protein PcxA [Symploca sp. SIO1C4]
MKLKSILNTLHQWFSDTPERALDQAYKAALMIKAIEDEHFNSQKISIQCSDQSRSVISYFEADLNKYLKTIKVRLAEFKTCRSVFGVSEPPMIDTSSVEAIERPARYYPLELNEQQAIIIDKLNFIDQVTSRYSTDKKPDPSASLVPLSKNQNQIFSPQDQDEQILKSLNELQSSSQSEDVDCNSVVVNSKKMTEKTGILPRSIVETVNRIQRELDPKAEEEVVSKFRTSKLKTVISIRFILTLIIVPVLTQQITKTFLVSPIVDSFRNHDEAGVFLNIDMEEEAYFELHKYEEKLRFESLIGIVPEVSPEQMEELVKHKAEEVAEEYRGRSANAVKNIFADLLSLAAFALVIVKSKRDIVIFKSFVDDIVYGLSDSAKAFIIILFTDMFVGFHSPHGWEVILESLSRHLGLPESRNFIFLFIATFPVILDSVIKYWIFRYLNRISPSAVATYKNMNE